MNRRLIQVPLLDARGRMGRQQVIQITCDRCTRVEHIPVSSVPPNDSKMFSGQFMGDEIEFTDLCSGCRAIIESRWETIKKELTKSSPIRVHKRGELKRRRAQAKED